MSRATAIAALLLAVAMAHADDRRLPLFDAHLHYNVEAWALLTPAQVRARLERAGVVGALVSSTPNEGTLKLHAELADRVVAMLRPYRTDADRDGWHTDPAIAEMIRAGLGTGAFHGIGELHVQAADVHGATFKLVADLARRHDLVLHVHCDVAALSSLLAIAPNVKVLWAHAGLSASPSDVAAVLERAPRLWVELSLRDADIAPDGRLDPEWRRLLVRHPDRLLVGSDTWANHRWDGYVAVLERTRAWLRQLPPAVARRIAVENAAALFPPTSKHADGGARP